MKKIILTFAVIFIAAFVFNFNSNAGCVQSLPKTLNACLNSHQLQYLDVVVSNGTVYISGEIQPQDMSTVQGCMNEYNAGASDCPGAPALITEPPTGNRAGANGSGGLYGG